MTSLYRVQLHARFTFADAARQADYIAALGITHLYLSPILQSAPGSAHGYDVVDHTTISTERGGETGLLALADTAREAGLGLVVDVVPNHMALTAPEHVNPQLWQVLAEGPDAEYAHWFDVDWDALDGRIGLPILFGSLDEALDRGDLTLGEHAGRQTIRYADHVLPVADGTQGDDPAEVLAGQHYLLAGWRDRDAVLNYRRYLDVDTLVCLRMEEQDVFETTHAKLLDLNRRGVVEGFRIDHVDGLVDPEQYLHRLREACRPGTAIWVEKILVDGEHLPPTWPVLGTTGYDAAAAVTAALLDPAAGPAIDDAWTDLGGEPELAPVVEDAKRTVVSRLLGPERARLARDAEAALPDRPAERLAEAVGELLVAAPAYRSYVRPGLPADPRESAVLDAAHDAAVAARPDLRAELADLVDRAKRADDLGVRLPLTWPAVQAKAVEDTAFCRWNRMVALNEIGSDPTVLDRAAPEILHSWAGWQQQHAPAALATLSTHDSKRSEDVRARLVALAGDAESWTRCSEAFAAAAVEHGVDPTTGHLVWQTLAGAGALGDARLHLYLLDAARQAGRHTAWVDGDPDYETRLLELADEAARPGTLKALVDTAVEHNAAAITASVLAHKLIQLTVPGVPDVYQGCEVANLMLADPDNRRPVDYDLLRWRLERVLSGDTDRHGLDDAKLLVTVQALRLRRELPAVFDEGSSYQPLTCPSRHLLGLLRGTGPLQVAVLVTRALQRLDAAGGWGETAVVLPEGLWRDELTGALHGGGENLCTDLFADLPVALLRRVHLT